MKHKKHYWPGAGWVAEYQVINSFSQSDFSLQHLQSYISSWSSLPAKGGAFPDGEPVSVDFIREARKRAIFCDCSQLYDYLFIELNVDDHALTEEEIQEYLKEAAYLYLIGKCDVKAFELILNMAGKSKNRISSKTADQILFDAVSSEERGLQIVKLLASASDTLKPTCKGIQKAKVEAAKNTNTDIVHYLAEWLKKESANLNTVVHHLTSCGTLFSLKTQRDDASALHAPENTHRATQSNSSRIGMPSLLRQLSI